MTSLGLFPRAAMGTPDWREHRERESEPLQLLAVMSLSLAYRKLLSVGHTKGEEEEELCRRREEGYMGICFLSFLCSLSTRVGVTYSRW
jgi:hypothetical protein